MNEVLASGTGRSWWCIDGYRRTKTCFLSCSMKFDLQWLFHFVCIVFKKNLNVSKPAEHPPSGEKLSKGLGENIGCRDKNSLWYKRVPQCSHIGSTV